MIEAVSSTNTSPFPVEGLLAKAAAGQIGPQAYLNYLVFDENLVLLEEQSGYIPLTQAAKEDGSNVPHEQLSKEIIAKQPGYVYIYLSNDSPMPKEVYFDQFNVEHAHSAIVQSDDYYPFGLSFNSYRRENSVANRFMYQSKELEEELGLNTFDFHARMYDPVLGRTWQQDPLASKYYSLSPYGWVANNPILFTDPTGMEIDWGDLKGKEKRIFKRALKKHKSSETYKNLYNQLKKSDTRYLMKADNKPTSMEGGSFEANWSATLEGPDGDKLIIQNSVTEDHFAVGEKGGMITLNFGLVDVFDTKEQSSILGDFVVEEVVHAVQYDDGDAGTAKANKEFEAKAIVGQIKSESKREMLTTEVDKIAHDVGTNAFKTGRITNYHHRLKEWHTDPRLSPLYKMRKRNDASPQLLQRLINR